MCALFERLGKEAVKARGARKGGKHTVQTDHFTHGDGVACSDVVWDVSGVSSGRKCRGEKGGGTVTDAVFGIDVVRKVF